MESSLITRETTQKNPFCRAEDEIIVNTFNQEGKTVSDVQKALTAAGYTRTKHSLQYRIRKLRSVKSWDDIKYADEQTDDANADANAEPAAEEVAVEEPKKAKKTGKNSGK